MSVPDMRLPIAYALFYPERGISDFGRIDFSAIDKLTFEKPDFEKFPVLKMAFEISETGGSAAAVFNAANEAAVDAFLKDIIKFNHISDIIINTVRRHKLIENPSLEDILEADVWARQTAEEIIS
jgi:1-deoxy-D-xylulose-5-phosphate reductoisomerase